MTINELFDWMKAHNAALHVKGEEPGSRCETITIRARAMPGEYYEASIALCDEYVATNVNAREETIKRLMRAVEAATG